MKIDRKKLSWPGVKEALRAWWQAVQTKPEIFFVSLAVVCGLVMVFLTPPFMVPDEKAHLSRAYQVSTGHIFSENKYGTTGGSLPISIHEASVDLLDGAWNGGPDTSIHFKKWLSTPLNDHDRVFMPFPETSVYSPVAYAPQAVGILAVKFWNPPVLLVLYAARLVNLTAFILLVYFAIRLMPVGKWLLAAVALLPMTMQQMASASPDVMTIGCIFLALAFCLRLATQKQALSKKQLWWGAGLAVLLGLTKQINALVLLPFLFLPRRVFGSKKRKFWLCAGLFGIAFGTTLLWYMIGKELHYDLDYSNTAGVDDAVQTQFILSHPWSYLAVLWRTFAGFGETIGLVPNIDFYWQSLVGYFSWFQFKLPLLNAALAYGALLAAFLYRPQAEKPHAEKIMQNRGLRVVLPIVAILSVVALLTILYLMWTPVYYQTVIGLQGRYLIPYIPFLLFLFYRQVSLNFTKPTYFGRLLGAVVLFNFATLCYVMVRFYHFM